ncbi:MAG: glutamine amidotransferase [Actinomycetaceae bacterium]|nr:glutamine amidotransferase [Actinomycetaceae bacterium]
MATPQQARFLFIQCRPDGAIARDERNSVASLAGLEERELDAIMLLDDPHLDPVLDVDVSAYTGVIISGSPFSARAEREATQPERACLHERVTRLASFLLDGDVPTLGLCYGLQMLACAAGASLTDTQAEDLQAVTIERTQAAVTDPVAYALPERMTAFVGHTDSLADLPEGAVLLGRGETCERQLVRFNTNLYGCQFHPEITTPGMRLRIDAYAGHYYGPDETAAVEERCLSQDVTSGHALIPAFVNHYRR